MPPCGRQINPDRFSYTLFQIASLEIKSCKENLVKTNLKYLKLEY